MKFPDKIFAYSSGFWTMVANRTGIYGEGLYIRFDLVPISCGGTMEENELETERLRLAACGVAAMSNTKFTVLTRITDESPYYSASYGDVCRAVDREIRYREALERLANLGNGSMRGNSTGNIIAQEALDLDRPPVVQQDAVLTSGSAEPTQDRLDKYSQAEFADKILEIRKLRKRVDELEAKLGGGTMEEESFTRYCPIHKIGIHYVCSKCQEEKIFAMCKTVLTSGSAEIQCPIKEKK
jgi:hypothetical protein